MGLTIHYQLSAPDGTDGNGALRLMCDAMRAADRRTGPAGFRATGRIGWTESDRNWSRRWRNIPLPPHPPDPRGLNGQPYYDLEIKPDQGWMLEVDVGQGCESLSVGLCRYPTSMNMPWQLHGWLPLNRRREKISTGLPPGWHFHGFVKTQFAAQHGWEHFRRCHTGIIDYLAELKTQGWGVHISDEGDYWPRRSLKKLRGNLEELHGPVAAALRRPSPPEGM